LRKEKAAAKEKADGERRERNKQAAAARRQFNIKEA